MAAMAEWRPTGPVCARRPRGSTGRPAGRGSPSAGCVCAARWRGERGEERKWTPPDERPPGKSALPPSTMYRARAKCKTAAYNRLTANATREWQLLSPTRAVVGQQWGSSVKTHAREYSSSHSDAQICPAGHSNWWRWRRRRANPWTNLPKISPQLGSILTLEGNEYL